MTTRELYTATINYLHGEPDVTAETLENEYITLLEKLDSAAENRRVKAAEKAAEKQAEKAPLREALYAVMGDAEHPMTASDLIAAAGLEETLKPTAVPALMKPMVEDGKVAKVDIKVTGKGTQRGYIRA